MSIFEDVKSHLNIKQVVEHYGYHVNRAGQFTCPFHNDSHPSASIKKDFFNCFVCGTGGDLITFTAKLFGLSNYEACKKLIADFQLPIYTGTLSPADKLKADREYHERLRKQKERKQLDALIQRTGSILAEYHCFLWQGKQLYPIDDERHIKALQELPTIDYYLQCYDEDPEGYSIEMRKQVKEIEERLYRFNH